MYIVHDIIQHKMTLSHVLSAHAICKPDWQKITSAVRETSGSRHVFPFKGAPLNPSIDSAVMVRGVQWGPELCPYDAERHKFVTCAFVGASKSDPCVGDC